MNQETINKIAIILAKRVNKQSHEVDRVAYHNMIRELADLFESEDKRIQSFPHQCKKRIRFDRQDFLKGCGL